MGLCSGTSLIFLLFFLLALPIFTGTGSKKSKQNLPAGRQGKRAPKFNRSAEFRRLDAVTQGSTLQHGAGVGGQLEGADWQQQCSRVKDFDRRLSSSNKGPIRGWAVVVL